MLCLGQLLVTPSTDMFMDVVENPPMNGIAQDVIGHHEQQSY